MHRLRPDSRCLRKQHAFTLVEVLAALLVLALALSALQLRMSQHLDSAAYLRDKTLANWVALNQLELLRVALRVGAPPPPGGSEGTVSMGGRTWYWVMTPQSGTGTEQQRVVPLTIGVSADSAEAARQSPLVALTGVSDAWQ